MTDVTVENFSEKVLNSEKPVLLDFWAAWCAPCKIMLPRLEALERNREDIVVCKVNVDANKDFAKEFGIISIPTLILFSGGKEIARCVGMPSGGLDSFVSQSLQA